MKWFSRKVLNTSFSSQLMIIFSVGLMLLMTISTIVISTLSSQGVRERLVEEGLSLTGTFATQSTLALLYESEDTARETIDTFMMFPDVLGVEILDIKFNVLGSEGETLTPFNGDNQNLESLKLLADEEHQWIFISPVYTGSIEQSENPFGEISTQKELIGYVRLAMSQQTLKKMEDDILKYNLMVSISMAAILLLILRAITDRVAIPIKNLASIMRRAEKGEQYMRAELKGTRDIVEMETAFNTMMAVLEARGKALELARDQALDLAKAKADFAANVSHELRTPMNGVLGMLELLSGMGLTEKQREYVETASNSAESLLSLINDILDFSKNEAGKSTLNVKELSLPKLLDDIVSLLSTQVQKKGVDLAYILAEGVPFNLVGDGDRIRQVLINLVANAIKFTQNGDIAIDVSVSDSDKEKVQLLFTVSDTGIGISEEAQSRIFDAFSQADSSTTRQYGGTGLGLSICKQFIELMGGEIGVRSRIGEGSEFWFRIPLLRSKQQPVNIEPSKPLLQSDYRILILDESALSRRFLKHLLHKENADVVAVATIENAMEAFVSANEQNRPFKVAFINEYVDGKRGVEIVKKMALVDREQNTRFVLMTRNDDDTQKRQKGLIVYQYISKPIQRSVFFSCLNSLLHPTPAEQRQAADSINNAESRSGDTYKILVVDDNKVNQQVALGMLERLGHSVELVGNGIECLKTIEKSAFDLILMDCHMPEMDGHEASKQIRSQEAPPERIPIVAMTANVQKGEREKCIASGMDDYLSKPLKISTLQKMLDKWLSSKKQADANNKETSTNDKHQESKVINRNALVELHSQIGDVLYVMVQAYLDDLPIYLSALDEAVESKNAKSFVDVVHTIRGSSANFGATRLVNVCQQLEELGRAELIEGADHLLNELKHESALVQQVLTQEYQIAVRAMNDLTKRPQITNDVGKLPEVLIVDDDRGSRFAMSEVLRNEGYHVIEACDGREAIICCERTTPDLVLMDAVMPEMDGFTACSMIKGFPNGKDIPVLIITALNDDSSISRAFSAGAIDYISKPVNFSVLRQRIARLLKASSAEKHVKQLAYRDTLTGLPNRSMFNERFNEILTKSRNSDAKVALMFLDLDRFKLINDTLGHEAGDLLLKYFADRMQGCMRKGDMVARFGGDEFTIVLDNVVSLDTVHGVVNKIQQQLSKPFVFMGKEIYINTSIGITLFPDDGQEISTLLKKADMAMYRAKEKGSKYQFYEEHMESRVSRRMDLENDLRKAIERNEIVVYYQPQENLNNGRLHGMEALVRWQHESRGLIGPADFISLAEDTGQIWEIGKWVLRKSCEQLRYWLDSGYEPVQLAVNLSSRQLVHPQLISEVGKILKETGLAAKYLELEITESVIMENPEDVIGTLEQLKNMGVRLAIDDFGTGYSSLNYLRRFPIDVIKIDRSFVSDITENQVDADIVNTIIALAHIMGVKVVAEGVETALQRDLLKQQSCDIIQGYYLSKPIPAEEFAHRFLLHSRSSAPINIQ